MKLEDFTEMVETRLKAESGNATEKSFLLEAYRVAEELKQIKKADDKENQNQEEVKTSKADYNVVEQKQVATIFDYARVCKSFEYCKTCPLSWRNNGKNISCDGFIARHTETANEIILKYLGEHPPKTYRQDFIEKFPNASVDENGYPLARTCDIYLRRLFPCEFDCNTCWDMVCKDD